MGKGCAVVFGGSGFLGRHVVLRLTAAGWRVRIASRNPQAQPADIADQIEVLRADVRDEAAVAAAVAGCDAVVNSVALYSERGADSFEAIHVTGAQRVARQAGLAGASRLVQISGINAGPESPSYYARIRGRGEVAVQEAFDKAIILRPSAIFGPGDSFVTFLAQVVRAAPLLPLFGSGDTKLQPVFVGDVAEAVVRVIDGETASSLYELGGPGTYSYKALLQLIMAHLGLNRLLMPFPFFLWEALAQSLRFLPSPPLSIDAVRLMKSDNVAGGATGSFADLGITPTALEALLPKILPPA